MSIRYSVNQSTGFTSYELLTGRQFPGTTAGVPALREEAPESEHLRQFKALKALVSSFTSQVNGDQGQEQGRIREVIKMGLWGNWRAMGVLGVITVVIVTVIFLACELPQDRPQITPVTLTSQARVRRIKRSTSGKTDTCLNYYGRTGSTTSFTFDLCALINCGGRSYRIYDIWVCYQLSVNRFCQQGWTRLSGRCVWSQVVETT